MKSKRTPKEMDTLLRNIKFCYENSNNFENKVWNQYVKKEEESLRFKPDIELNKLASVKWNNQRPEKRYAYKKQKNPSAKQDSILRLYSEGELHDYMRRFQYCDSIFNLPISVIIERFQIWCTDRFLKYFLCYSINKTY